MRRGADVIISWPGYLNPRQPESPEPDQPDLAGLADGSGAGDATDTITGEEVCYRLTEPY